MRDTRQYEISGCTTYWKVREPSQHEILGSRTHQEAGLTRQYKIQRSTRYQDIRDTRKSAGTGDQTVYTIYIYIYDVPGNAR